MPEHMSSNPDLDRAFDSLTRDLAARPGAPGATAAMATARRRRRTTIATVGAVAALAVGAVVLPQLVGGSTSDGRSQVASSGEPLVFTGAALTDAAEGWTGPWTEPVKDKDLSAISFPDLGCFNELDGGDAEPVRTGDLVLIDGTSGAYVTFADFGQRQVAAAVTEALAPAEVEDACGTTVDLLDQGDTIVRHAHLARSGGRPSTEWWLAVEGSRVAMLVLAAPAGAPAGVQDRVGALLARALDADDNFERSMSRTGTGTSSGSASSTSGEVPEYSGIRRDDVAAVTGGWPARVTNPLELPCAVDYDLLDNAWGSSMSDDAGFTTSYAGVGSVEAARGSVDKVALQFRSCQRTTWDVETGTVKGDRTLRAGSTDGTVVLVQHETVLAWVSIGEPDAPADAVEAVIGLLRENLVSGGR